MSATIGRVLLMPKGNYSGSTVYNSLDWVRDNGAAWVCKVDGTVGIAPPTLPTTSNANWTLLSADGSVTGSVDWPNVNYKPFDDIKSGGGLSVDGSKKLQLDTSYLTGSNISYDNTSSGLLATTIQLAIDELAASGGGGGSYTASKGVKLVGSDIRANLKSDTTGSLTAASKDSTNNREYAVGLDSNNNLSVNIPWTDTTPNDSTITIQKNGVLVDTFTTDASSSKTINIPDDEWSAESTVGVTNSAASGHVVFTGLNDDYGYDLYCKDTLIGISAMTKTGSGTNVTLDFEVTGATDGTTKCKLRILK